MQQFSELTENTYANSHQNQSLKNAILGNCRNSTDLTFFGRFDNDRVGIFTKTQSRRLFRFIQNFCFLNFDDLIRSRRSKLLTWADSQRDIFI